MAPPQSVHMADLLDEMAAAFGDRDAVAFAGSRWSYRRLQSEARAMGRALQRLGVRRGDRVGLLMSNRPEWMLAAFGAFSIGATLVPLSTWYRSWELAHVIAQAQIRLLVMMERLRRNDYWQELLKIAPEIGRRPRESLRPAAFPELEKIVLLGEPRPSAYDLRQLVRESPAASDAALSGCERDPDDLAYIIYTSGTTSAPKGVMIRQRDCVQNAFNIGERQHLGPDDRLWLCVSLAWALGCENALPAIMTHGGCAVLQEYFDPGEALALFAREGVTVYYATPNITKALISHPDFRPGGHRLRTGVTIGVPQEIREAIAVLGVPRICNVYGSTETYGNCAVTDAELPDAVRAQCQGEPLPGMTIRIVDPESDRPLRPNQQGEIWVGGRISPGYWNDPERTAAAFRDGYYRSGDLGYLDDHGRVHFVNRMKDMIKTGGINVAPAEVEDFLHSHPKVGEAYVLGVPDAIKGEAVFAYVQPAGGAQIAAGELRAFCRERLAAYKVPVAFHFIEERDVPRTVTGKVNKVALLQMAAAAMQAATGAQGG